MPVSVCFLDVGQSHDLTSFLRSPCVGFAEDAAEDVLPNSDMLRPVFVVAYFEAERLDIVAGFVEIVVGEILTIEINQIFGII